MFAPTSRLSSTLSSWWINSIPRAPASRGERISTGSPLILMVPASLEMAPPRIFISVDFPAPFSPMSATISPVPTDKLTWSSATTPGNRLLIPSISRIEAFVAKVSSDLLTAERLAAATEPVDLFRKLFNVGFLHRERWYEDLLAARNLRLVAIQDLRHQFHRSITKLKRLLHDRGVNGAVFDPAQGLVFFVERDNFHLVGFVGFSDSRENCRSIVGPEANHAGDVGIIHEGVGGIRFCANAIRVVSTHVDNLHIRSGKRFL